MRKKLLCILGISILLVGCGKKKEQYPEVAGEYYAEDDTEIILYADGKADNHCGRRCFFEWEKHDGKRFGKGLGIYVY